MCHYCLVAKLCLDYFVTPWTVTPQPLFFMGFHRQEYWSGLLFPSQGDLLNPGIKPMSPALTGRFLTSEPPCVTIGINSENTVLSEKSHMQKTMHSMILYM